MIPNNVYTKKGGCIMWIEWINNSSKEVYVQTGYTIDKAGIKTYTLVEKTKVNGDIVDVQVIRASEKSVFERFKRLN